MSDEIRFAKYHGTGNDFVFVEDLDDERPLSAELTAAVCDRRFGVGADGTIRVTRASVPGALFFMDYVNADGSLAEMCGNGIRCLGKLVFDRGFTDLTEFDVDTRGGIKHLSLDVRDGAVANVTVGMGPAVFTRTAIPMTGPADGVFLGESLEISPGVTVTASAVSMGNPHLVLFVDVDPSAIDVARIGPVLEHLDLFPEKTNVEFVRAEGDRLNARVWERGSGETMACGTGACAVMVAANEAGLVADTAMVRFPGGVLTVERTPTDVLLTGPAVKVFDGVAHAATLLERSSVS